MTRISLIFFNFLFFNSFAASSSASDIQAINFNEKVISSDTVWVVEFYSQMCGACEEFEPTWNKV